MFEFGALPPEVNSGWIYTGPGAAPMTAAAAAWHTLAAELGSTAAAYQAVVARMSGELWTGAASASMAAAAAPYVAWLNTTAAQAEQAANQASAAAAAFETAFAMTVPPPVIAANRSLLLTLVATNLLGQNTPAIAATEAHYAQMWAQDAAAMYGYAGASAAAAQLTPFTEPGQTTNPAGLAGQAAAVGQAAGNSQTTQLISTLPTVLQGLASPLQAGGITDNFNGLVNTGAWNVASTLSTSLGFLSNLGSSAGSALGSAGSGGLTSAAVTPMAALGSAGLGGLGAFGGAPVSASLGQAGTAGMLSVPPAWAANAAAAAAGSPALPGATLTSAAERGVGAMPAGMPIGALGARAASAGTAPSYGFRPTVVMHPVAAG